MTDTTETIAERIDALEQRAETEIRNPALGGIIADMLALLREIDATDHGTGITPAELAQAVGGVEFLASLARLLREIAGAREADVARVVDHVLRSRPPAPPRTAQDGAAPPHP